MELCVWKEATRVRGEHHFKCFPSVHAETSWIDWPLPSVSFLLEL